MPEPCQLLHNKNITYTILCIKEQFGYLGAKEFFLAAFIISYPRWPRAHHDFSAAKLTGILMSENKREMGKILFVPKTKWKDTEDPCQGRWEGSRKPCLTQKGDAKALSCSWFTVWFRNAAEPWRIGNPWRKMLHDHQINDCHITWICEDIDHICVTEPGILLPKARFHKTFSTSKYMLPDKLCFASLV